MVGVVETVAFKIVATVLLGYMCFDSCKRAGRLLAKGFTSRKDIPFFAGLGFWLIAVVDVFLIVVLLFGGVV